MVLCKTAYYESGVGHSAFTTEEEFISYSVRHNFNAPATVTVYLSDPDGSTTRKYKGKTNIYTGPGLLKIEDPDATTDFDGRIIKAAHDLAGNRCILIAQDMMSQLDEKRINYDMREDLDGAGLRQSVASAVPDSVVYVGPVSTDIAPAPDEYYLYDRSANWDNDEFNGYFLVFMSEMGGGTTIKTGPYTSSFTAAVDTETNSQDNVWVDDSNFHRLADDGAAAASFFTLSYDYRILIEQSDFYVAGSLSAARIRLTYSLVGHASAAYNDVLIEDIGDVVTHRMGDLEIDGTVRTVTFNVPSTVLSIMAETDGQVEIKFRIATANGPATTLTIYHAELQVDCETTYDNGAYEILDMGAATQIMEVDTNLHADLGVDGIGIWEGCPYAIARSLRYRINSMVTDNDLLAAMTTSIETEADGAISTQHFTEMTIYEMFIALGIADKAVFWVTLGGKELTWKRTFNDGAPTEITDADILAWQGGEWDYQPVINEVHLYGTRTGDNQLFVDSSDLTPDPGADSKTDYLMTRTEIITSSGIVSEYDAEEIVKSQVGAKSEILLFLTAVLSGRTELRLGDELNINSALIGLTDAKYVVTGYAYNSREYRTVLELHPRVSVGYVTRVTFGSTMKENNEMVKKVSRQQFSPPLYKQDWVI